MLLYLCFIPGYIVWFLVRLRDDCQLYPGDDFYQPHWTTRFGFLFAG